MGQQSFTRKTGQHHQALATQEAELYEQFGRLKMDIAWLKKLPKSIEANRKMIEPDHIEIGLRRQCSLKGLDRATYY